ncbi:MAG: hypothetical protein AAGJ08_14385 [Cyanobacteria bacterium P01_H01_bin.35]
MLKQRPYGVSMIVVYSSLNGCKKGGFRPPGFGKEEGRKLSLPRIEDLKAGKKLKFPVGIHP